MKFLLFVCFVAFVSCEFDSKTFDWTSIKPITQTKAYREAFAHLSAGEFLDEDIKVSRNRGGRIIRGEVAHPLDFPFQVGLIISLVDEQSWCSGSLINVKSVLTAASCLIGSPTVTALLGASDILEFKEIIYVESFIVHEKFKRNLDNDIAILTLARAATLCPEVNIVRLPQANQASDSFTDRTSTIAGWGSTGNKFDPLPTPYLLSVRAQVISNTACLLRFPLYISSTNICTNVAIGTPCTGDEGGALTIVDSYRLRTQIGIFSYQYSMGCDRGWPAVFTRVTSYLTWIEDNSRIEP